MIQFKPIILSALHKVNYYFQFQNYRTCDFTMGGLFMWASYFKYEYAIFKDTLFIKGLSEINLSETAFSIPIGKLQKQDSIAVLSEYCSKKEIKLILSAVPEEGLSCLQDIFLFQSIKLENWSDYLYNIQSLSSLSGKSYSKKRNHINKFHHLYPNYYYEIITNINILEVISFFRKYNSLNNKGTPVFLNESNMTEFVLQHYSDFNFIGALIRINTEVVGFIIGEILYDTLYIHINKANKDYEGIYEMMNQKFVSDILKNNANLLYVNAAEDVGDEGLRKSKLSYHPIKLLHKYNIEFQ